MYTVKSDPHFSGEVWRALRAAAPQTVPAFAGYLVLGMGYGLYPGAAGAAGVLTETQFFA